MTAQRRSFSIVGLSSNGLQNVALTVLGAYLLVVSANWRVLLPISPVPITGQTLTVLLIGALLGARRGALSVGLYLVGSASGLPLFAGGSLVGPTGGYLVGFAAAAALIGRLFEAGWARRRLTTMAALFLGNATIYAFGLPWLAGFVGWGAVLPLGLYPFLVGDGLKLGCAACLLVAWQERN